MLRSTLLAATLLCTPATFALVTVAPATFAPAALDPAALAPATVASVGRDPSDLTERFEALDDAGDRAGIVELWRAHPYDALPVIDSYLEGSLAAIEADPAKRGSDEIEALHARALRGARAADQAFGRAIFSDYAASFAGWTAEEGARFRRGQQAFGEFRAASKAGRHESALEHASACVELAEPLGDWWGTAMGLGGMGAALHALGRDAEALVPLSRARLLNHELGLAGSEYGNLRTLVDVLVALDKSSRAKVAIESALVLAELLGDEAGRAALAKTKLELESATDWLELEKAND